MGEYIPSPSAWVSEQVELYEGSNGKEGTTLLSVDHPRETGLPVIIVTHTGRTTRAIRKTPLMKVVDGDNYVLVASKGGSPKHPVWYHNLKADPNVEIRDEDKLYDMTVREVSDPAERTRLWDLAVEAYSPYHEYQVKTERLIPVFIAEPVS